MARSERDFYKELRYAFQAIYECHVLRIVSLAQIGIPDMYIKIPGIDKPIWFELKYTTKVVGERNIGLTPLQMEFLHRAQRSGAIAGWVLGTGEGEMYASGVIRGKVRPKEDFVCRRERGQKWDVQALMLKVTQSSCGEREAYTGQPM